MYFNDGTWSEGLVSAAKHVASATQELCESANEAAKVGTSTNRDRVIVAAKGVSACTTQLLTSAMVKADAQSQSQAKLMAAGRAVNNATNELVKASKECMAFSDTDELSSALLDDKSTAATKIMEMEAQMSILKMEKELERARNKLAVVRKGKYEKEVASKKSTATGRK